METKLSKIDIAAKNAITSLCEYHNLVISAYCDANPQDNCYL